MSAHRLWMKSGASGRAVNFNHAPVDDNENHDIQSRHGKLHEERLQENTEERPQLHGFKLGLHIVQYIRRDGGGVILPIAGLVLTFVMTYELIQMLIDHNNLHNFDTWIFFKWIFKTFVAVLILSNTFNIVMAVFDVSQQVIQQSAGLIQGSTAVTPPPGSFLPVPQSLRPAHSHL